MGMRLAIDKQRDYARALLGRMRDELDGGVADAILGAEQITEADIRRQRERVSQLKASLDGREDAAAQDLRSVADALVRKSVWIVGGDGWAYDIGFGGVDHVLASRENVNLLILDTEVYSNTGGQASKSTPIGAVAKFAAGGKTVSKKDIGAIAMSYRNAYVAQVAMGADENQTIKAFEEAEAFDGPSLIIAYSHCIAHGYDMAKGMHQQKLASKTGYWPLYRYDPRRRGEQSPLQLDSKPPAMPLREYIYNENRYNLLRRVRPKVAAALLQEAEASIADRWQRLLALAEAKEA